MDAAGFNRLYPGQMMTDDARRIDGRPDGKARPISLNLDTIRSANGSCMCKLGGTVVMAGVQAKVSKSMQGNLSHSVDVAPFALSQMKSGQATELQASLSERLHGLFIGLPSSSDSLEPQPSSSTSRGCLDVGKLVIAHGKASWNLCLDLLVLNMDGSVLDACVLASMAALLSLKLPAVTITPEGEVVKASEAEDDNEQQAAKKRKMNEDGGGGQVEMRHRPFSITLALQKDGRVLVDPSGEEEMTSGSIVTVMIDEESNLHGLFFPGGSHAVSQDKLLHCIESAKLHRKELDALLARSISEANTEEASV